MYNDHLIDGKKHFHFDNNEKKVHIKMDFNGNILECKGRINKKVHNILISFLQQESVSKELVQLWDKII